MYIEVQLKESSHFSCDDHEIIFLEGNDKSLACFIENNMTSLKAILDEEGGTFIYLPELVDDIVNSLRPHYYAPQIEKDKGLPENISLSYLIKNEIQNVDFSSIAGAFIGSTVWGNIYLCVIDEQDIQSIGKAALDFLAYCLTSERIMYSRTGLLLLDSDEPDPEDYADDNFEEIIKKLSEDIRAKVNELRSYGISEYAIRTLFEEEQKLSRLVVTSDYRIILPDYNDMEIKLEPLPKAVYMLFLRHPEGLRFKELPHYRDELARIYMNITNRNNIGSVYKSIEDVTDPTKNSINEKCSRIKEAFISRFDDRLAENYYITGLAGWKKGIRLKREMVMCKSV